jgi:hypothetical protein
VLEGKAKLEYHRAWIIAKCDDSLVDYYRWWFWKEKHVKLMKPKFGAHISIVRGEEEGIIKGNWEPNKDGGWINFSYNQDVKEVANYVWLLVYGDDLGRIREEVGLSKEPIKPFHMTVGRT